MSTNQRYEVWRGLREKTSGGLTKSMLTKNKRGKIVSKKKSEQASSQNNLGSWLRKKGAKIEKADMLRKKSAPPEDAPISKKKADGSGTKGPSRKRQQAPAAKAKAVPAKVQAAPKKKVAPKQKAPKKKVAAKAPKKKPKKKVVPSKAKSNINPITQQPYDKKSSSGYVEKGAVSIDNIVVGKRKRRAPQKYGF